MLILRCVCPLLLSTLLFCIQELYDSAKLKIEGPIDFRHSYVRMSNQTVEFQGETVRDVLRVQVLQFISILFLIYLFCTSSGNRLHV